MKNWLTLCLKTNSNWLELLKADSNWLKLIQTDSRLDSNWFKHWFKLLTNAMNKILQHVLLKPTQTSTNSFKMNQEHVQIELKNDSNCLQLFKTDSDWFKLIQTDSRTGSKWVKKFSIRIRTD